MDLSRVSNLPVLKISLDGGHATVENPTSSTTVDVDAETVNLARQQALEECSSIARELGRPVKVETYEAATDETFHLIVGTEPGEVAEDTVSAYVSAPDKRRAKKKTKPSKKPSTKGPRTSGTRPLLGRTNIIRIMLVLVACLVLAVGVAGVRHVVSASHHEPTSTPTTHSDGPWSQSITTASTPIGGSDGKSVLVSTGGHYTVLDADNGEKIMTLGEDKDQTDVGVLNGGGMVTLDQKRALIYKPGEDKPSELPISSGSKWAVRAGSLIQLPSTNASTPDEVVVRTMDNTDGVHFKSPAKNASFAVPNPAGTSAFWASAQDGGTLLEADAGGKISHSTKLSGPKDQSLQSWVGSTPDGHAITYWKAKNGSDKTLVVHDPQTGEPVSTVPGGDQNSQQIVYSGNSLYTSGNIVSYDGHAAPAPEGASQVKPTTGGFTADNSSGHRSFIADDGKETPGDAEYVVVENPHLIKASNNKIERGE